MPFIQFPKCLIQGQSYCPSSHKMDYFEANLRYQSSIFTAICRDYILWVFHTLFKKKKKKKSRAAQVAQRVSAAFSPGRDPEDPGSSPTSRPRIESHVGLPAWSLLLPLPVSLPLSFSVSLMNK